MPRIASSYIWRGTIKPESTARERKDCAHIEIDSFRFILDDNESELCLAVRPIDLRSTNIVFCREFESKIQNELSQGSYNKYS